MLLKRLFELLLGAAAENIVIAPYSGTEHLASLVHSISDTVTPRPSERPKLAFFRGNCGPWEQVAPGAIIGIYWVFLGYLRRGMW